jgi:hypothetical protein
MGAIPGANGSAWPPRYLVLGRDCPREVVSLPSVDSGCLSADLLHPIITVVAAALIGGLAGTIVTTYVNIGNDGRLWRDEDFEVARGPEHPRDTTDMKVPVAIPKNLSALATTRSKKGTSMTGRRLLC